MLCPEMLPVITVVHVQRPAVGGDVDDDGEGEGDNEGDVAQLEY